VTPSDPRAEGRAQGGSDRGVVVLPWGERAGSPPVVVVRHGETTWSREGRHTGRSDVALTAEGEVQARRLAPLLAGLVADGAEVLCSPLARARRTADLAGLGAARFTVLDDLREWDYGLYEGRTSEEIRRERPGWSPFGDGFPEGETLSQLAARADRVVERLRSTSGSTSRPIIVVAHGHLLRVLAARWCGLPAPTAAALALGAGSLGCLGYEHRSDPVVLQWNLTPAPADPTAADGESSGTGRQGS